ncbi:MAG: hypothetical protein E7589_05925 [Ruminococcaceae bacterium]|nr:hypothetical protein [Oscillospiraceae bacterium]
MTKIFGASGNSCRRVAKCGIIGCGSLGAEVAHLLVSSALFGEMVLIDDRCNIGYSRNSGDAAEALSRDIAAGFPFLPPVNIYAGDYADLGDCCIAVITKGADFSSIIKKIKCVTTDAVLIVAAERDDILTHLAANVFEYPPSKVLGLGTFADTARLNSLISNHLGVERDGVCAFIIGMQGADELAAWSCATVCGMPMERYFQLCGSGYDRSMPASFFDEIRSSSHTSDYATALSVCNIARAILYDSDAVMTVCTNTAGAYGHDGACLSLPCIVGFGGVRRVLEIPLDKNEEEKLCRSAAKLLKEIKGYC